MRPGARDCRAGASGRRTAFAGRGRDAAGGVVRCRRKAPGRLLLMIHHLAVDGVSWRILVPDLAAAWGACAGPHARIAAARQLVPALGAWLATKAQDAGRVEELRFWTRDAGMGRSLPLFDGALDRARDVGARPGIDADAARVRDGRVVDAGAGGVPWRHPRSAADGSGGGDRGLVPAAWSEGKRPPCWSMSKVMAGRSGREEGRGDRLRPRSLAHGGLVHQPVPGAA